MINTHLPYVLELCDRAGKAILRHYRSRVVVQEKPDKSPLTAADLAANRVILEGLARLDPSTPILSEESPIPPFPERKAWTRFWLVDPLDGTKEFLKGNDEFTVNIALIENAEPIIGAVYAPAKGLLYFAAKGEGAFKRDGEARPVRIFCQKADPTKPLVMVESRSHPSPDVEDFLKRYAIARRISAGSSLKFCLVAEGKADIYPRLGPTMEWDVAAGDCIYRNSARSGFHKTSLSYNKPDLRNSAFVIGLYD